MAKKPNPTTGGRFERDPKSGKLTRVDDRSPPPARPGAPKPETKGA